MNELMPLVQSDMLRMLSRMERLMGRTGIGGEDEGTLPLDIYEENEELFVEASVPG